MPRVEDANMQSPNTSRASTEIYYSIYRQISSPPPVGTIIKVRCSTCSFADVANTRLATCRSQALVQKLSAAMEKHKASNALSHSRRQKAGASLPRRY
jgi:hypothetical protein